MLQLGYMIRAFKPEIWDQKSFHFGIPLGGMLNVTLSLSLRRNFVKLVCPGPHPMSLLFDFAYYGQGYPTVSPAMQRRGFVVMGR